MNLHTAVAATNLSIPQARVTKEQRQEFKNKTFRGLYGGVVDTNNFFPSEIAAEAFSDPAKYPVIEDVQYTRKY